MTTATEYKLQALEIRHLTWMTRSDRLCIFNDVTRQDVLDELHDRAIRDYAASSQGIDDLVVALGHALSGRLATFSGAELIRSLGVLADHADAQDWTELAAAKLPRSAVVGALHGLALREVTT